MKRLSLILALMLVVLIGCTPQEEATEADGEDGNIKVIASFFPIADFTERIGGEHVKVETLIQGGTDPHSWEMSTTDRNRVEQADLFIYNGARFEHWVDDLLETVENQDLVAVESARNVDLAEGHSHDHDHDDHDHDHEEEAHDHDDHDHGPYDAHTWISLRNAVVQMETIKDALVELDPDNAETYESNFEKEKEAFLALDQKAQELFQDVDRKDFIVGHESFGYFARDYGLTQHGIEGAASHGEPDPATMANLVRLAQDTGIHTVFYDPLGSDKTAQAIAAEIGGTAVPLNPLEGRTDEETEQGLGTLEIMEQNIEALHKALTDE